MVGQAYFAWSNLVSGFHMPPEQAWEVTWPEYVLLTLDTGDHSEQADDYDDEVMDTEEATAWFSSWASDSHVVTINEG